MRIVIIQAALLTLCAGAAASAAGDGTVEKKVSAEPRGVVEITNTAGTVDVAGWDNAEVGVRAELDEGVERVDVDGEHGHVNVRVVLPSGSSRNNEAHLHVRIPRGSELHVTTVSADQVIAGVSGLQRLSSVSGDVTTELAGADLELKSVSGDVKVRGRGQPARMHVSTVSGDVHIEHVAGDLEAGSVSGNAVLIMDSAGSVRLRTTSGDLLFLGKLKQGASLDAASVSGAISARAPSEGGYSYEASTFSGDISDCFDAHSEKAGAGHTLTGTRGNGSGRVTLKAMSGDVQLCDHD